MSGPAPKRAAVQLELFTVEPAAARPQHSLGSRGFPMCSVCRTRESIGPRKAGGLDLCTNCWSPVLDPIGAAAWDRIRAEGRRVETVLVSGGAL